MAPGPTWEQEANHWITWARTPGHDVFSVYAPPFFDEIVPEPDGLTLEIGCGEGRVARELAARGHRVVALDASSTLARAAKAIDATSAYVIADATSVPFAAGTFHTVVGYNSLQTMQNLGDMPAAVREAARLLHPSGSLCLCVGHPMTDVGVIKPATIGGEMVMGGSYFEHQRVDETVTKNGLTVTFSGWTYTLEDYFRAIEDAGLFIARVREPAPDEESVQPLPSLAVWRRLPHFLSIRAVKRG